MTTTTPRHCQHCVPGCPGGTPLPPKIGGPCVDPTPHTGEYARWEHTDGPTHCPRCSERLAIVKSLLAVSRRFREAITDPERRGGEFNLQMASTAYWTVATEIGADHYEGLLDEGADRRLIIDPERTS